MLDNATTLNPAKETPDLMRVALLVEYNGARFAGSQFQPSRPTVQSTIQEALAALNLQTSAVTFAGRTDAGVHARGQVAHFEMARDGLKNIPSLREALNAKLMAHGIGIRDVRQDVGFKFHSRHRAELKWYRYQVLNTPQNSVWAPADSVWMARPLDVERMNQAAQAMLGRHNFNSFKCPDTLVVDDICDVRLTRVSRQGEMVIFDVVANRFLYKMVRNLMGELLEIGKAQRPVEHIHYLLEARQRVSGITGKPEGLSLMAILYQPEYRFFERDYYVQQLKGMIENPQHAMESKNNELQNLFRKAS